MHYYQELRKTSTCEAHRPYFLLYGPKTAKLNGFGFRWYGKTSQGRGWFETSNTIVSTVRVTFNSVHGSSSGDPVISVVEPVCSPGRQCAQ